MKKNRKLESPKNDQPEPELAWSFDADGEPIQEKRILAEFTDSFGQTWDVG